MKFCSQKWWLAAALPLLAGCVNDDYDLSDIDTTTRVSVNDLILPVNIDAITLGDVISVDEDSRIKPVIINGQEFYALTENGEFHSDDIKVMEVKADAPTLNSTSATLQLVTPAGNIRCAEGLSLTYNITPMGDDFDYNAGHVDDAIEQLHSVKADMWCRITLSAPGLADMASEITFNNVVIKLPLGLEGTSGDGTYNPADGTWTIEKYTIYGGETSADVTIYATGIDFVKAGAQIDSNHQFDFKGQFRILSGTMTVTPKLSVTLPSSIGFRADYAVSDLEATAFSGVVNYHLDGLDIAPINLNDIPDFLAGEGTNISIANPQIYLNVNNPVAGNSLDCRTGLRLTAYRNSGNPLTFQPDENEILIGHNRGADGPYNFVLAPDGTNLNTPDHYSDNLKWVRFTTLSDLLATPEGYPVQGIPTSIGIDLTDPCIPMQEVKDFALGRALPGVRGTYELVAPLALTSDSHIVYTDTEDGWSSEDLDAVTITTLTVTATAVNNCPAGIQLTAWPVDVNGNRIDAEITTNYIEPNTDGEVPVEIKMHGTVRKLDGITFSARLTGSNANEPLKPQQTLVLKNIRAKVSGYYEKEL